MPTKDTAKDIKDALAAAWGPSGPVVEDRRPGWDVTLHVNDDFVPTKDSRTLLVADDGGPQAVRWWLSIRQTPRRPLIRFTAYAKDRSGCREVADAAADWFLAHHTDAGVAHIEDVSDPLITRDRATGAYLASVTMPVIVRPV